MTDDDLNALELHRLYEACERLQAENAQLRAFAEAFAEHEPLSMHPGEDVGYCQQCGAELPLYGDDKDAAKHADTCLWKRARAWLDAHPKP